LPREAAGADTTAVRDQSRFVCYPLCLLHGPTAKGLLFMSPFLSLFVPVFLFLMLLTIGFSLRERNIGVLMMWIGTLGIFGLTCWKILEKLPT
jgi:hypothetical protein